jgi:hypothetical protein
MEADDKQDRTGDAFERSSGPFQGMTVNERLFAAGALSTWDNVVQARDRLEMIRLLVSVDLPQQEAERIADAVLANPKMYGF